MALKQPEDVLEFWFDGKFDNDEAMSSFERTGANMAPLWFGVSMKVAGRMKPIDAELKGKLDAQCQPFAETIRAAARGELKGAEWETERGVYAMMVLCDQIS